MQTFLKSLLFVIPMDSQEYQQHTWKRIQCFEYLKHIIAAARNGLHQLSWRENSLKKECFFIIFNQSLISINFVLFLLVNLPQYPYHTVLRIVSKVFLTMALKIIQKLWLMYLNFLTSLENVDMQQLNMRIYSQILWKHTDVSAALLRKAALVFEEEKREKIKHGECGTVYFLHE